MNETRIAFALAIAICFGCSRTSSQELQGLQGLPLVESPPPIGTFYSLSSSIPYPFDPAFGQAPVYEWRPGVYLVDDSQLFLAAVENQLAGGAILMSGPSPCNPCSTNGGTAGGPKSWGGNYSHTNVLWLELTSVGMTNDVATFVIHTTETNAVYDLFATTNLTKVVAGLNQTNWVFWTRTGPGQTNLSITNLWPREGWFQLGTLIDDDAGGGDGLTTAYEILVSHTDPSDPDHDDDGILDGIEVWYSLNPHVADPPFSISITQPSPILP